MIVCEFRGGLFIVNTSCVSQNYSCILLFWVKWWGLFISACSPLSSVALSDNRVQCLYSFMLSWVKVYSLISKRETKLVTQYIIIFCAEWGGKANQTWERWQSFRGLKKGGWPMQLWFNLRAVKEVKMKRRFWPYYAFCLYKRELGRPHLPRWSTMREDRTTIQTFE